MMCEVAQKLESSNSFNLKTFPWWKSFSYKALTLETPSMNVKEKRLLIIII